MYLHHRSILQVHPLFTYLLVHISTTLPPRSLRCHLLYHRPPATRPNISFPSISIQPHPPGIYYLKRSSIKIMNIPSATMSQHSIVIGTYRSLAKLVRRLPQKQQTGAWKQLREGYRNNANESSPEKITHLIQEAGNKIAFLRIVTPKDMWRNTSDALENTSATSSSTNQSGVTRWVYRSSGEKDANGQATKRMPQQVVSNFTGSNLDPCNVKRHSQHLKKLGFANNLHAKGLF